MKELLSCDVWFDSPVGAYYVNSTPQEAFALMSMPCFLGIVSKVIPIYGVPSVSESENEE